MLNTNSKFQIMFNIMLLVHQMGIFLNLAALQHLSSLLEMDQLFSSMATHKPSKNHVKLFWWHFQLFCTIYCYIHKGNPIFKANNLVPEQISNQNILGMGPLLNFIVKSNISFYFTLGLTPNKSLKKFSAKQVNNSEIWFYADMPIYILRLNDWLFFSRTNYRKWIIN